MSADEFEAWYRETLDAIGLGLSPHEGVQGALPSTLPASLKGWYQAAGSSRLNSAHNRILPSDLLYLVGDKVVFCEENQAVVKWGFDASTSECDPDVWQGQSDPMVHDSTVWYSEDLPVSRFIVEMLRCTVAIDSDQ